MNKYLVFICAILLFLCATSETFATQIFTNESAFLGAIKPGYYLEEFNSYSGYGYLGASRSFGPTNGFSYTITAPPDGLYKVYGAISTTTWDDPLTITFTGSPVTAIGGLFFPTEYWGSPVTGDINFWLSDGTTFNVLNANLTTFRGFTTTGAAFTQMKITSLEYELYPTVDHFYVGQVIPEPSTILLLGAGLLGCGLITRIRRRRNA